jgi:predicted nucleotidyltransferase
MRGISYCTTEAPVLHLSKQLLCKEKEMGKTHESLKKIVEESFLKIIQESFRDNLYSVILYGSYVSGSYVSGLSDINMLLLLSAPASEQVEQFGKNSHRLMRKYRITPIILTIAEFEGSADVFPMEYMDIKERYRVIHGTDATQTLTFTLKNLRHQLEDRLRGNLASLRQLLTASRGRERQIGAYLKNSYGSLGTLFRSLLRIKKIQPVPVESEELLGRVGELFGIDTDPFKKLISFRNGEKAAPKQILFGLISSLEALTSRIDTLKVEV